MVLGRLRGGTMACAVAWLAVLGSVTSSCNPEPSVRHELTSDCVPKPTPICGNSCMSSGTCGVGCMTCRGPDWCLGGTVYHCEDTCIRIVEVCPGTDSCVASGCARSISNCDAIRTAYEQTIKPVASSVVAVVRVGAD